MKKLINEEIKKFINENYGSGNKFSFSQTLQGIEQLSFFNYDSFTDEYDVDIIDGVVTVKWNLIVDVRGWGVKGITIDVSEVEGTYLLNLLDKQTDEVIQETEKNIAEVDWKFVVDNFVTTIESPIYAKQMTFDFKANTCTVDF